MYICIYMCICIHACVCVCMHILSNLAAGTIREA